MTRRYADSKKRRYTNQFSLNLLDAVEKRSYNATHRVAEITEDGILSSILSSLKIRDAVRTSILSSRCRHLWTYLPNLIFDHHNMFRNNSIEGLSMLTVEEKNIYLEERANKFIYYVNKFLQYHQGTGVMNFEVIFNLHKKHSNHLDKWVDFGITSGAQNLRIKLLEWEDEPRALPTELYNFPHQLFAGRRGSSVESLTLVFCTLRVPPNFDGFYSLKKLNLSKVSVDERGIQDLLSTCPSLEWLSIEACAELVNLRIRNPSGKLKFLCVGECHLLENVEVFAINLIIFEYYGRWVSFLFRNVPQLTRAYIAFDESDDTVEYVLNGLHDNMPLLETLLFRIKTLLKVRNRPVNCIAFTHLKHLVMDIDLPTSELLWIASILSIAPFLKKFQLNLHFWEMRQTHKECKESDGVEEGSIRRLPKCPHNHLKEIEINGFTAALSQIELVIHMLNNAVALEVMTITSSIKTHSVKFDLDSYRDLWPLSQEARNKSLAYLLGEVPPGAKLVIL